MFKWIFGVLQICKVHCFKLIKPNSLLFSLYYDEACYEFAGLSSASLRPGSAAFFEEILQWWRAVGKTPSDLTGMRFESQTSISRDEGFTA